MKCLVELAVALFVVQIAIQPSVSSAADNQGTMLWISDIHFDPFCGGQVVQLANNSKTGWKDHTQWQSILKAMPGNLVSAPAGSDANDHLFHKVLDGATRQLTKKPDFILITGDFLSHDFNESYFSKNHLPASLMSAALYNRFIDQTLAYIALSVSQAFPEVPVIAALGNNDAYCGDYDIRGNSGFLAATRKTWIKYFLPSLSKDFESVGGCYTTPVPGTKHRFVVLNSVPFISDYPESFRITSNPKLNSFCKPLRTVELVDEMNWFKDTMATCEEGQRVWIACHIPPGVSGYGGAQNWPRIVGQTSMPLINLFSDFYLAHRRNFAGILTGHSHSAEFKLIRDNKEPAEAVSFVLMAPSIGRNHGNNSSYRVLKFDRSTLAINDYTTHWLDGSKSPPDWGKPFQFSKCYGQPDVSPSSLSNIYDGMVSGKKAPTGKTLLNQYLFDYSTRNGAGNGHARSHYKMAVGSIIGP